MVIVPSLINRHYVLDLSPGRSFVESMVERGHDVYIANAVKCRPPNNRTPEADELAACFPYLRRQIELIKPRGAAAILASAPIVMVAIDLNDSSEDLKEALRVTTQRIITPQEVGGIENTMQKFDEKSIDVAFDQSRTDRSFLSVGVCNGRRRRHRAAHRPAARAGAPPSPPRTR